MITLHNPDSVVAPASFYSQAAEVGPARRWLHISGQVGIAPDGTLADGFEAQSDQVWRNIEALLAAAGMTMENLVIVRALLVNRAHLAAYREIRDRHLQRPSGGIDAAHRRRPCRRALADRDRGARRRLIRRCQLPRPRPRRSRPR